MTRAEIIDRIAKDAGISKNTAKIAFESALVAIKNGLRETDSKVSLVGFGTFRNVYRKPRMGYNPNTGGMMEIKGRNVVTFRPSKYLP